MQSGKHYSNGTGTQALARLSGISLQSGNRTRKHVSVGDAQNIGLECLQSDLRGIWRSYRMRVISSVGRSYQMTLYAVGCCTKAYGQNGKPPVRG